MDLQLSDKVFLVSGGSEGIGEAVTRTLLAEGAKVMIATISEGPTEALKAEYQRDGLWVAAVYGDLSLKENCREAVEACLSIFGRLDGVVNNAGVNDGAGLEAGPEAFRDSLKKNLMHYFDLVHYAMPHLKQSRGNIVNIGSKVALTGQGATSGYAASKGAVLGLTREWALDLAPHSIRVNAVLPAEVMTPLYRRWLNSNFTNPAEQEATIGASIPLENRMTTPQEIADTVVFLLSPRSSHTTGQWMVVDGGYVHLDR